MYYTLEFYRGAAAWMIVAMHFMSNQHLALALNSQYLATGVEVFFIISGFVFARYILEGRKNYRAFYIRRIFRIYPLYLASLILYLLVTPDDPLKIKYFIKHLFFLNTTTSIKEAYFFNPAYWTLPVEVEFYLLVPLLSYICQKNERSLFYLFVIAIAFQAGMEYMSHQIGIIKIFLRYHIFGFLPQFLVGTIVYKFYMENKERTYSLNAITRYISYLVVGLTLFVCISIYMSNILAPGNSWRNIVFAGINISILFSVAIGVIIYASLQLARVIGEKYQNVYIKNIAYTLGSLSFGVYLTHIFITKIVRTHLDIVSDPALIYLIKILAVIFLSFALYYLVENPMRLLGRKISNQMRPEKL